MGERRTEREQGVVRASKTSLGVAEEEEEEAVEVEKTEMRVDPSKGVKLKRPREAEAPHRF